jgi:4-oxalomesaconate tautomerase
MLVFRLKAWSQLENSIPCLWMRGGSSKAAFFVASDLPAETAPRDAILLRVMGSPDARQIDGMGGAHPLTSKACADVDFLFTQVGVDAATRAAAHFIPMARPM